MVLFFFFKTSDVLPCQSFIELLNSRPAFGCKLIQITRGIFGLRHKAGLREQLAKRSASGWNEAGH